MKKVMFLVLLFPALINAQSSFASIKAGYYSPDAADGGFIIGYEGGKFFDDNLNIGWSVDWFNKNYVDQSLVKRFEEIGGIQGGTINQLRAKTNLHDIPVMFNVTANFPTAPKFRAFLSGGVGVEALFIFYRNYDNPDEDDFQAAFDFNWRISGGVIYELGRRSDLFFELSYHSSNPSWTFEVPSINGTTTFEREYDMSGIISRFGIRFLF